jgi:hypothetical protein
LQQLGTAALGFNGRGFCLFSCPLAANLENDLWC